MDKRKSELKDAIVEAALAWALCVPAAEYKERAALIALDRACLRYQAEFGDTP